MFTSFQHNQLTIAKYLHQTYQVAPHDNFIITAVREGHIGMVIWFYETFNKPKTFYENLKRFENEDNEHVMKWLQSI